MSGENGESCYSLYYFIMVTYEYEAYCLTYKVENDLETTTLRDESYV